GHAKYRAETPASCVFTALGKFGVFGLQVSNIEGSPIEDRGHSCGRGDEPGCVRVRKSFKAFSPVCSRRFCSSFFRGETSSRRGRSPTVHVLAASRSPQREVGHAWRSGEANVGKPMQTQVQGALPPIRWRKY